MPITLTIQVPDDLVDRLDALWNESREEIAKGRRRTCTLEGARGELECVPL